MSNAALGECTGTGGYISNAELQDIIDAGGVTQFRDADSDILVYGGTEWVSYMTDDTKASRETLYAGYNFAGTTDWAVDLQAYTADEDSALTEDDPLYGTYEEIVRIHDKTACSSQYSSLEQLEKDAEKIPAECMAQYIVTAETAMLDSALNSYDDLIHGGYDKKFTVYEKATRDQVPLQIYTYSTLLIVFHVAILTFQPSSGWRSGIRLLRVHREEESMLFQRLYIGIWV